MEHTVKIAVLNEDEMRAVDEFADFADKAVEGLSKALREAIDAIPLGTPERLAALESLCEYKYSDLYSRKRNVSTLLLDSVKEKKIDVEFTI